jgi:uncharacterized delta-60 repeat protein
MRCETLELRRLLAAPQIDLTFGEGGVAFLPDSNGTIFVVHELQSGKIVAAGSGPNGEDPIVLRFNADGSLDSSFDGDGVLTLPQNDEGYGTVGGGAIGRDGKIVLDHWHQGELRIFRFNADGTIDTSFGAAGKVVLNIDALGGAIALQSDGKIILSYEASNQSYLSRLNANGSVDTTFRGGIAAQALPVNVERESLAIDASNRIYVAQDIFGEDANARIARFNSSGALDTSFGDSGFATLLPPGDTSGTPRFHRITIDPNGKILVASQAGDDRILVTRFLSSGARDTSFGGGDAVVDAGSASGPVPTPVLVDADGNIVGAFLGDASAPFTIFELSPDGSAESKSAPQARVFLADHAIAFGNDGELLFAGAALGLDDSAIGVARYVDHPVDAFVNSAGHLFVSSTDDADTISLEHAGDQLIVHRNGVDFPFNFADVNLLRIYASAGGDTIDVPFKLDCHIETGTGNDTISLGDGDDTIDAGSGNDRVTAGDGDHDIDLFSGDNYCSAGSGNDSVQAGGGNDTILTRARGDTIEPGAGDDSITTGSGWDFIYTFTGNDTVHAGAGNDVIQDISTPAEPNPDDELPEPTPPGLSTGDKHYFGEDGDDSLYGSAGRDTLMGGGGRDTIIGQASSDYISGGGGDDSLVGNGGNDRLRGGDSRDRVYGNRGDDRLFGGAGADSLRGGDGFDTLFGDGGNDHLYGDLGPDTLHGGAGDDFFLTKDDSDTDKIFGDGGRDTADADAKDVLASIDVHS